MKVRFEYPTSGHARIVANNMRPQDMEEIRAGWRLEPEEAILTAIRSSPEAAAVFYGLELWAIFGIAHLTILGESAQVWCFGTTAIDRHAFAFARESKRILSYLHSHARILTNYVDAGDRKALRWLEYLGATYVLQPQMRGGRLFAQFILSQEQRQCQQA